MVNFSNTVLNDVTPSVLADGLNLVLSTSVLPIQDILGDVEKPILTLPDHVTRKV